MSREIKFRAYQKTPSLNHKPSLYEVIGLDFYEGDYGGGEVCLKNKKGEQWTEYIKDVVLEQYTGLKDKNGKEIYEGDIMRFDAIDYEIYWSSDFSGWHNRRTDKGERIYGSNSFEEVTRFGSVIGNIHENTELLGGTNVTNKEEK